MSRVDIPRGFMNLYWQWRMLFVFLHFNTCSKCMCNVLITHMSCYKHAKCINMLHTRTCRYKKNGENKYVLKMPTKILTRLNWWHVSALVRVNKILYHNYREQVISEARLARLNDSLTCEKEFGQNWSYWLCRSNVKVTQPPVLSFNWVFFHQWFSELEAIVQTDMFP